MPHNGLPHEGEIDTTLTVAKVEPDLPPKRPTNIALVDRPGTREFEAKQRADAQQSIGKTMGATIGFSVQNAMRMAEDEGVVGLLFGYRPEGTAYNKVDAQAELPASFNELQARAVLSEPTLESHLRAVARIEDEIARGQILSQQSAGSQLGALAASFIDADLPLFLVSGGAFGAAKLTRNLLRASTRMGLTPRAATRFAGLGVGASAGFQAGLAVGVVDQLGRDTAEFGDLAAILLMSTAGGAVLGGSFNLNRRLNQAAAETEFFKRVATDADSGNTHINGEGMLHSSDAPDAPVSPDATIIGGETPQSLGAAATGTGGRPRRVLEDPAGPIGTPEAEWIDFADKWRNDSNFLDSKAADSQTWWAAVATNQLGGFSTHNFHDLYKSPAAMANWIAGTIFESPSGLGRGRLTASTAMEMYHSRIQTPIAGGTDPLMHLWAQENGQTWGNTGYHISNAGKRAWSRELMLEMSDRALGKTSTRNKHIRDAGDLYDAAGLEAHSVGRGRDGQRSLDGFEPGTGVEAKSGYNPYRWAGFQINKFMRDGFTLQELVDGLADGYRRAGMDTGKDAEAVAKAVLLRARQGDFGFDSSVGTMLSGDGRTFLKENLALSGMSQIDIDNLMRRLMGSAEEAGKESFAKRRNELDLAVEITSKKTGEKIQLVDMLEQNMHRTWQRYARQMSGAAALARKGVTNRVQRKTLIAALRAEQRAMGLEPTDADLMNAMFSHFDAGPVWGFSGGQINKGIGRMAATAKRLANISLLEQLGITQLGELGAVIAQMGPVRFYKRGIEPWFNPMLREENGKLLDDTRYILGETGLDHRQLAEWLDLDDVGKAETRTLVEKIQQNLSDWTSNAAFIQNYLNLFNTVRSYQQKIALMGMVDKVFRELKFNGGAEGPFLKRATKDLGLDLEILQELEIMMNDPKMMTWSDDGKYVLRMNFEAWDPDLAETFGAALVRNKNQVVQRSMAGEQDAWMHTGWGSLMTHLMTFPMAAFQKQFLRHASQLDLQAFSALSFGMLTALVAVNIKDAASGRDDTAEGRMIRAFNYNNMSSWVAMVWDPAATVTGQNDARINNFGPYSSMIPPTLTQLDSMRRAPGAVINALAGDFDYYDRQALKALPFAGTLVVSRMFKKPSVDAGPSNNSLSDILNNPGVAAAIQAGDN